MRISTSAILGLLFVGVLGVFFTNTSVYSAEKKNSEWKQVMFCKDNSFQNDDSEGCFVIGDESTIQPIKALNDQFYTKGCQEMRMQQIKGYIRSAVIESPAYKGVFGLGMSKSTHQGLLFSLRNKNGPGCNEPMS